MNSSVSEVIGIINNSQLTAEECIAIYSALRSQKVVFGGKLLTDKEIERVLEDDFGLTDVTIEEDWIVDIKDILNNSKREVLDGSNDEVSSAIKEAVRDAGITIHISNIEWSVDDEAELEDLYTEKDIPLTELEGYYSVCDYLTEDSGYCVVNFS